MGEFVDRKTRFEVVYHHTAIFVVGDDKVIRRVSKSDIVTIQNDTTEGKNHRQFLH